MRQEIKQVVGIDISKSTFDAVICIVDNDGKESYITADSFDNNKKGFRKLLSWVRKNSNKQVEITYLMEATGVYYEELAYFLHELKKRVVVILANKVKNFARCLNIKSKTDKIDSKTIAIMGIQQQLQLWQPPKPIYRQMRSLTRLYQDLKVQHNVFTNHIESIKFSFSDGKDIALKSYKKLIDLIDKQIEECENELKKLIASDLEIQERVSNIQTIKGIGFITTAIVVAETFGFENIVNQKQLASYAGLDVVERQSGTSVKGRSRISKKGNSRIRGALYVPAMSACRYNVKMKNYYDRVNSRKTAKKPGIIAVERKLLLLMYTIWKKNEPAIA